MPRRRPSLLQSNHLQALAAIAREGSIHRAARALGVPQPALSRLLLAAETLVGARLFERSRAGTIATAAGDRVLREADFALRAIERVGEAAVESVPTVRVGCIPRAMHGLVPRILDALNAGRPSLRLHVSLGTSNELAANLHAARIDFALGRRVPPPRRGVPELEAEMLYHERTVVVCGAANRSVPTAIVGIRQLAEFSWVLPKPGYFSRDLLDRIVFAAGLPQLVPVIEAQSFESSLPIVAETKFLTIAPEFAARRFERLHLVRTVRTRPTLGSSPVMLLYRAEQRAHPAFTAFRAAALASARKRRALAEEA